MVGISRFFVIYWCRFRSFAIFFPGDREGVILFVCLSVYVRLIKDVLFFGFSGWNNLKEPIGNFLNMSKLMRGYF